MDGIEQNFHGLLGCFQGTFGWVVCLPSPYGVSPSLLPSLFPEINLLHGFWCYRIMSYHYSKHLTRQTKL